MPTYQYVCTACGEPLEAVQSFTDATLTQCPACAGSLRKVFSAVGVVFKGSGFYKTDSRSSSGGDKKPDAPKTDGGATSDSPVKADSTTKTDSKSSSSSSTPNASSTSSTSSTPAAKTA